MTFLVSFSHACLTCGAHCNHTVDIDKRKGLKCFHTNAYYKIFNIDGKSKSLEARRIRALKPSEFEYDPHERIRATGIFKPDRFSTMKIATPTD